MKIVTHNNEEPIRLELKGKLVGAAADELVSAVDTATSSRHEVVLDMRALAIVDSAGLEALLKCHEHCVAAGGQCVLIHASPKIERLLRITRLDRDLEVVAAAR